MDLDRRLTRIEGKINILLRALSWVLAFVIGFGMYFLTRGESFDVFLGFGAAIVAVAAMEWQIRRLEKLFPLDDEDDD
jgi:hypothetical protein